MLAINNLCSAFRQRGNVSEIAALLDETTEIFRTHSCNLDILLQDLDVKDYSIVHATVLYHKINQVLPESIEFNEILNKVNEFLSGCCKNQIRTYYKFFINMIQELSKKIPQSLSPFKGIKCVINGLNQFQKDNKELTPIHNNLAQLALYTKHFDEVVEILDEDIMDLHKSVDATCYESFYYFGGMVYLAVKNFERAQYFFELCLFNPTNNINRIIKEAYKKFSLLTLINSHFVDRNIDKPLFSARLDRQLKDMFKMTYGEFITAFNTKSHSKLSEISDTHRALFENDLNYGLIKQCLKWHREREILKLTKIYVSLSFSELTEILELRSNDETERILFSMISRGIIDAKIDQKNQIVGFNENCESSDSLDILQKLQEKMESCMKLQVGIHKLNDKMSLDANYLKKLLEKEMASMK